MGFTDDVRRRWRDLRTTDTDIRTGGRPEVRLQQLDRNLARLTSAERAQELNQIKAYTEKYYVRHQREEIPKETLDKLNKVTQEGARLDRVERAEEVIAKYGGPPTRKTLEAAIQRSEEARLKLRTGAGTEKPALAYSDPLRPTAQAVPPDGPKSRIARGGGVDLEAKPLAQWTKAELAKEIKTLRQHYQEAVSAGKPKEEIRAIVARDTAVRNAYAERVVFTPEAANAETVSVERTVKATAGGETPREQRLTSTLPVQTASPPDLSLAAYTAAAERLRGQRADSAELSNTIEKLSAPQIEERLRQLEPALQAQKPDVGVQRERDLLVTAREFKRTEIQPFDHDAWKAAKQATPQQVAAELKSLQKQLQDGIKAHASREQLEPLVARDHAIREARPDVVKAQSVREAVKPSKVSVSF